MSKSIPPEQLAEDALSHNQEWIDHPRLKRYITEAIEKAISQERDRCASIALQIHPGEMWTDITAAEQGAFSLACSCIELEIREGKEPDD